MSPTAMSFTAELLLISEATMPAVELVEAKSAAARRVAAAVTAWALTATGGGLSGPEQLAAPKTSGARTTKAGANLLVSFMQREATEHRRKSREDQVSVLRSGAHGFRGLPEPEPARDAACAELLRRQEGVAGDRRRVAAGQLRHAAVVVAESFARFRGRGSTEGLLRDPVGDVIRVLRHRARVPDGIRVVADPVV